MTIDHLCNPFDAHPLALDAEERLTITVSVAEELATAVDAYFKEVFSGLYD